jgi:hypothetical protein
MVANDTERMTIAQCVFRWGIFLLFAGYLLFAHGCHAGDQDNELFAWDSARTPPAASLQWK